MDKQQQKTTIKKILKKESKKKNNNKSSCPLPDWLKSNTIMDHHVRDFGNYNK